MIRTNYEYDTIHLIIVLHYYPKNAIQRIRTWTRIQFARRLAYFSQLLIPRLLAINTAPRRPP